MKIVMHLECSYRAELQRHDHYDYVRTVAINVKAHDDAVDEFTVGRIVLDKVLWQDAQVDGISLFEVCDADSAGLTEVYRVLTDPDQEWELREDLNIHGVVNEVLFINRIVLHPDVTDRRAVIEAALHAVTTDDALVVMWRSPPGNTEISDKELSELGFAKIVGESLIYRDMHYETAFTKEYPSGRDVEILGTQEHEDWVREQWGEGE